MRASGVAPGSSCGVYFGCLVRRASFHASGIADTTDYLCDDATRRVASFVAQKSIVESMHDLVSKDPQRLVMTMSLRDDYPPAAALDLCKRGVSEMRAFLS